MAGVLPRTQGSAIELSGKLVEQVVLDKAASSHIGGQAISPSTAQFYINMYGRLMRKRRGLFCHRGRVISVTGGVVCHVYCFTKGSPFAASELVTKTKLKLLLKK